MIEIAGLHAILGDATPIGATCAALVGPDHADTLSTCNIVAEAYLVTGGLDKAVPLQKKTQSDLVRTTRTR